MSGVVPGTKYKKNKPSSQLPRPATTLGFVFVSRRQSSTLAPPKLGPIMLFRLGRQHLSDRLTIPYAKLQPTPRLKQAPRFKKSPTAYDYVVNGFAEGRSLENLSGRQCETAEPLQDSNPAKDSLHAASTKRYLFRDSDNFT